MIDKRKNSAREFVRAVRDRLLAIVYPRRNDEADEGDHVIYEDLVYKSS